MGWVISVPVWGEQYTRVFAEAAFPALRAAIRRLGLPVRLVVHTRQRDIAGLSVLGRLASEQPPALVEFRDIPDKPTYAALQAGHADAVRSAAPGDRVVLLNADIVVSGNLLVRCAEHFAAGRQAVVLMGIRTTAGSERPPAGAPPRALLEWAWEHRHQIIRDLEVRGGQSGLPTNLFWTSPASSSVVARGFHLHPVAVVKHADVNFKSTIDGDLLDYFPRAAVHVVTSPDDCAMCEVSPPDKRFPLVPRPLTPGAVVASMMSRASATHRWLFEHRILVRGSADEVTEDVPFAAAVLAGLRSSTFWGSK